MPTWIDLPADATTEPLRKSIQVRANAARAFKVFTEGLDSWWPRTHHIGESPMVRVVMECHAGGRCYSEQVDGTECDWARVTVWDPPHRFVMAWLMKLEGQKWVPEADATICSEVEVTFNPQPDGSTFVELEHREFDRMLAGGAIMRASVDGGWPGVLALYQTHLEAEA
jgi:uncharacterized protein YndB with AHSA1/START domain